MKFIIIAIALSLTACASNRSTYEKEIQRLEANQKEINRQIDDLEVRAKALKKCP